MWVGSSPGHGAPRLVVRIARSSGGYDRRMPLHVQTVLGPVAPEVLGFTLPHEHTRCVLWQIPDRWDYWELTGEDELILPELARFRELGGTCLADLTLAAIGRDPLRLRRLAEASGLHLVMS